MSMIKVVKVFIGSPGGLDKEREEAKRIVDEINNSHSENWGCRIHLVGWELTLPGYSRAQSLINQDLDKCQYFVGVIWNNWGSKPDDGDSKYTSGFEEEFERAKSRTEVEQMEDLFLFFKEIPDTQIKDPGPSVEKVIAFREKCIEEHKLLFKQFSNLSEFERLFRATIEAIGWKESNEWFLRPSPDAEIVQSTQTDSSIQDPSFSGKGLIETSTAEFISELIQRPSDWDATTSSEIARFRLVAHSLRRPDNDETYLGNHDANLLFLNRSMFEFSEKEKIALVNAGIANFSSQNVPLWHWLRNMPAKFSGFERVRISAVLGNAQETKNSIQILSVIK